MWGIMLHLGLSFKNEWSEILLVFKYSYASSFIFIFLLPKQRKIKNEHRREKHDEQQLIPLGLVNLSLGYGAQPHNHNP